MPLALPPRSEGQGPSTGVAGAALPFREHLVRQQKAWASLHLLTAAPGSTSAPGADPASSSGKGGKGRRDRQGAAVIPGTQEPTELEEAALGLRADETSAL